MITVTNSNNLPVLKNIVSEKYDLIYLDPPFGTGHRQIKRTTKGKAGFGSKRYDVTELARMEYNDNYEDYGGFLFPIIEELHRVLKSSGSILLHCDTNESHYIKIFLDNLFGRENFRNEIIWTC